MNRFDKIARMKPEQKNHWIDIPELSYWGERIFGEIAVAEELNEGGRYDSLLEAAVDCLYRDFTEKNALTDEACRKAEEILLPISPEVKKFKVHCVAHAHIDMDWLWGFHETVDVVLNTFRTMLDLMDEYPDFTFSQSQCAVYRIAEKYDPALFRRMKQRIREGRFEFAGSSYVELDKNMPNLESMARHILYTKKYLHDTFGIPYDAVNQDFHPDSFGHSPCVPDILSAGGVKFFYHCRGMDGTQIYRWRGRSGAEVLAVNEPLWYNDAVKPMYLNLLVQVCRKYGVRDAMKIYGVGDHGGGPTRKDLEAILDMQTWPLAPQLFFSTYEAYFRAIEPYKDQFPVLEGEHGPTFTGCYTSQSKCKLANRIGEDRLYLSEALTAFAVKNLGMEDFNENFRFAWEKILFNQFHDILPGSNVPESRDHAWGNFEEALGVAMSASGASLRAFAEAMDTSGYETPCDKKLSRSEGGGVGLNTDASHRYRLPGAERGRGKTRPLHFFNPTAFDREGVQEATVWDWPGNPDQLRVRDTGGNLLPVQVTKHGSLDWNHVRTDLLIELKVPAFGYTTVCLTEEPREGFCFSALPPDPRVTYYHPLVLENDRVKLTFREEDFSLASYYDKEQQKELLGPKGARFILNRERISPKSGSAWVEGVFLSSTDLHREGSPQFLELDENGKLRKRFAYTLHYKETRLSVTVTLDEGSKVAEFAVDTHFMELPEAGKNVPHLSFCADLSYAPKVWRCDAQIGLLDREPEALHDGWARDFAFAPDGEGHGAALLTDSKYGYRVCGTTLQVSLLRSSTNPDPYPEMGQRFFRLGLSAAEDDAMSLKALGSAFSHRDLPFCSNTAHEGKLPLDGRFLEINGKVCVSCVKVAEDRSGLILRLANPEKAESAVTVTLPGMQRAQLTDLAEQVLSSCAVENSAVTVTLTPLGTVTLKLQ